MRAERGVTLIELAVALAIVALGVGIAGPKLGGALDGFRVHGATADLYGAVHLTRSHARLTGVMHALVLDPDGRGFRIVEESTATPRTVDGPHLLPDGAVASGNTVIRISAKGFAVPAGTITVRSGGEVRRIIVNILGRARVAWGPGP